eukprot:114981-Amphidinium_carterae.2
MQQSCRLHMDVTLFKGRRIVERDSHEADRLGASQQELSVTLPLVFYAWQDIPRGQERLNVQGECLQERSHCGPHLAKGTC